MKHLKKEPLKKLYRIASEIDIQKWKEASNREENILEKGLDQKDEEDTEDKKDN